MTEKHSAPDIEDDHDLLTYAQAEERIREEIGAAEARLDTLRSSAEGSAEERSRLIESAESRLARLREAARRNARPVQTTTGFLGYTGRSSEPKHAND
jgi:hypothetical protein